MSHVHGQSNRTIPIDDVQFKTIEKVAFADHIYIYMGYLHKQLAQSIATR